MTKPVKIGLIAAVAACAIALGVFGGLWFTGALNDTPVADGTAPEPEQQTAETTARGEWGAAVTFDGQSYRRNSDVKTLLFMGVDDTPNSGGAQILGNGGRADTVVAIVLNKAQKTMQLVQISRETMTEVKIYDENDQYVNTITTQLTLQYSYGSSPRRSQWLMSNAVSSLLFGQPIAGCVSLTMPGIRAIVDAMGGLTLTLQQDYTEIDPAYTAGATVTLDGPAAERFIRYRDINVSGSNDTRMARQAELVATLFATMGKNMGASDVTRLMNAAGDALYTDVDAETLNSLTQYTMLPTLTLPGGVQQGFSHDEYYVDEPALQQMVLQLYYNPTH